jgi:GNAT superfamily N-acetyltransferase
VTFDRLTERDFDEARALAHRIWHEHYSGIVTPEQIDYMLAKRFTKENLMGYLNSPEKRWYLVREAGDLVGYFSFAEVEPNVVKLEQIYVLSERRKLGIGTRIIEWVAAEARRRGANRLELTVNKRNASSIRFYERRGFEKMEAAVFEIGNGYVMDDFVLERKLHEEAPGDPRRFLG